MEGILKTVEPWNPMMAGLKSTLKTTEPWNGFRWILKVVEPWDHRMGWVGRVLKAHRATGRVALGRKGVFKEHRMMGWIWSEGKLSAPLPSVCNAGRTGASAAAGQAEPHHSLAQPLRGPACPRYGNCCSQGCFSQQIHPKNRFPSGWRWPRACFEFSPLIFLVDTQLSAELQEIHSRLLNGTANGKVEKQGGEIQPEPQH